MAINKNRADLKFYRKWSDLKQRCNNPKHKKFKDYGGRGITYCKEWENYEGFKKDMWSSYLEHCICFGEKETTLDRINVNQGYFKENCRWATYKEQAINIRNKEQYVAIYIDTNEKTVFNNCTQFCKDNNFSRSSVIACISGLRKSHKGYIFRKALKEEMLNSFSEHIYVIQKIEQENEQEKIKKYENYYEVYKTLGFKQFKKITNYPYSYENLIQLFTKYIDGFVPRKSKKAK